MKKTVGAHRISFAIVVFLMAIALVHFYLKPGFVYNHDGTFKQFGLGSKQKTVLPMWVVCICLAILSYLFILWRSR